MRRYAYTLAHPGRWISLNLKKKKKMGGGRRKQKVIQPAPRVREDGEEDDEDEYRSEDEQEQQVSCLLSFSLVVLCNLELTRLALDPFLRAADGSRRSHFRRGG